MHGHANLPAHINPQSSYDVFSLFFDDTSLAILVQHTNEYAQLYPSEDKPSACT